MSTRIARNVPNYRGVGLLFCLETVCTPVSDPDTDPYTAYYEFDPVYDDVTDRSTVRNHADVRYELGLAGSPCPDRGWGTKIEVRCPGCGVTGKIVAWDDGENVYSCADCDTVFDLPADSLDRRATRPDGVPNKRLVS